MAEAARLPAALYHLYETEQWSPGEEEIARLAVTLDLDGDQLQLLAARMWPEEESA